MRARIAAAAVALILCSGARAQTSRGAVAGAVTDSTGGVIAQAAVTRRNTLPTGGTNNFDLSIAT